MGWVACRVCKCAVLGPAGGVHTEQTVCLGVCQCVPQPPERWHCWLWRPQDWRNICEGVYALPWDMTTRGHRQWSPLWVARRSAQVPPPPPCYMPRFMPTRRGGARSQIAGKGMNCLLEGAGTHGTFQQGPSCVLCMAEELQLHVLVLRGRLHANTCAEVPLLMLVGLLNMLRSPQRCG